ncbi:MAG TPA: LiaF domain-containing protein [Polyangiaceae bacterium]|nr:LiaF domain-containing protein [Polyangiaceae bacterium]
MEGERHPARLAVAAAREQVLEQLSDAFAQDELGLDEFEARVDGAYQAATEEGLRALVKDLTPAAFAAPTSSGATTALAVPGERVKRVMAVLGNVERRGRFRLASGYQVLSVLGNVELDLRDALFPDGVTEIHVRAVLGNVEITVPPTLPVECEGSGILASFAELNRLPAEGEAIGPVLRIVGTAVLGNVEIRTLPRGVSLPGAGHAFSSAPRARALPPKQGGGS